MTEYFDVVDDDDRVIGRASREDVHRLHLLHRSVHVYVFNARGELFLQKRSMQKDLYAGKWTGSASGHVDSGESYLACAKRELREELGIVADLVEAYRFTYEGLEEREKSALFLARHEGPMSLNAAEVSDGRFTPLEEVTRWLESRPEDFAPGFKAGFERFLATRPPLPLAGRAKPSGAAFRSLERPPSRCVCR